MKLLKTSYRMWRFTFGDFTGLQVLKKYWYLGRVCIWARVVDTEEVPSWASIQRATLGSTEWVSRLWQEYAHLPIGKGPA